MLDGAWSKWDGEEDEYEKAVARERVKQEVQQQFEASKSQLVSSTQASFPSSQTCQSLTTVNRLTITLTDAGAAEGHRLRKRPNNGLHIPSAHRTAPLVSSMHPQPLSIPRAR